MKKDHIPTLEDVARQAGVSTATISRCVNNPDKVAKPTRRIIEKTIKKLGYTPNLGGRLLATNKTRMVGAIIPSMTNAMFSNGIQAFQETLGKNDITLLIASSGYDPENEYQQVRSLLASGVGGLLLVGTKRPRKTTKLIAQRKIPYVITWAYKEGPENNYAGFNNRKSAYNLARLVIEYGHKDIAMIAGISKNNDRAGDRIQGVKDAIAEAGKPVRLVDLVETKYRIETGGKALEQIISKVEKPSVIICGNDVLAAGAITRARQRGIRMPEDISITGFDDLNIASVVTPPLTTVQVPHAAMGRAAANLLLDLIDDPGKGKAVEFNTEIIQRQSLIRLSPA